MKQIQFDNSYSLSNNDFHRNVLSYHLMSSTYLKNRKIEVSWENSFFYSDLMNRVAYLVNWYILKMKKCWLVFLVTFTWQLSSITPIIIDQICRICTNINQTIWCSNIIKFLCFWSWIYCKQDSNNFEVSLFFPTNKSSKLTPNISINPLFDWLQPLDFITQLNISVSTWN